MLGLMKGYRRLLRLERIASMKYIVGEGVPQAFRYSLSAITILQNNKRTYWWYVGKVGKVVSETRSLGCLDTNVRPLITWGG
jgi:hypothetical protein